jgi:hypothetical protein
MHGSPLDWWFERCRRAHAFARTRLPVYTIIGRPPTCLRDVPKSPGRTGRVDAYDGRTLEISRYSLFKPDPRKDRRRRNGDGAREDGISHDRKLSSGENQVPSKWLDVEAQPDAAELPVHAMSR